MSDTEQLIYEECNEVIDKCINGLTEIINDADKLIIELNNEITKSKNKMLNK